MARVIFKSDQPVQILSGIYCGVLYKALSNGSCSAVLIPLPSEDDAAANPAARAERTVKLCVSDIQRRMSDQKAAMREYRAIQQRVQRLYKQLHMLEDDDTKLRQMILDAYYQSRRSLPSRKNGAIQLALAPDPEK